jgi:hypothetical protein
MKAGSLKALNRFSHDGGNGCSKRLFLPPLFWAVLTGKPYLLFKMVQWIIVFSGARSARRESADQICRGDYSPRNSRI